MTKSIVTDAHADPTGASDSTISLQAALTNGGDWYWDAGNYKVSQILSASTPGFHHGVPGATTITTTSPTLDVLQVNARNVSLFGLAFASSVPKSAGAFINLLTGVHYVDIDQFLMTAPFIGINIQAPPGSDHPSSSISISRGQISSTPSNGTGIIVSAGTNLWIDRVTMNGPSQAEAGITVTGCGDLTITRCQLLHAGIGLSLQAAGPSALIQTVRLFESMLDTGDYGVVANATGGGRIEDTAISGSWTSTMSQHGILIRTDGVSGSAVSGFSVLDHRALFCTANGFTACDAGCTDVHVDNLYASGNTTGAAFGIVSPMNGFQIRGGKLGPYRLTPGNKYGLVVGAGCDHFDIDGVNCNGNALVGASIGQPAPAAVLGVSYYVRLIG